jgi:hypothetical protein
VRGRERVRKKHLAQAGWRITAEAAAGEKRYRLSLLDPDGKETSVEAATRPRAFLAAEVLARSRRPA